MRVSGDRREMETKREKILVVDDEPHIIELIELYLAREGFRVVSALDGDSAIEVFRAENPDLVVLDMMLPGKHGFNVLREIRSSTGVPVLMLTASESVADRTLGLELGSGGVLLKPFDPGEMVSMVKTALCHRVTPGEAGGT